MDDMILRFYQEQKILFNEYFDHVFNLIIPCSLLQGKAFFVRTEVLSSDTLLLTAGRFIAESI
jgi:hypothetical protein